MKSLTLPVFLLMAVPAVSGPPAAGLLRPHPDNPRWFADLSGRAVLLAGSHNWQSLQDNGVLLRGGHTNPPPIFDYDAYLDRLEGWGHNFFRLWRWETTRWSDEYTGPAGHPRRPARSRGHGRGGGLADVHDAVPRTCRAVPATDLIA